MDFTGEVEAAMRICDGAFLVVDVVEGVRVQTVTVLRSALKHEIRPVLVLNKIDRLFTELNLDPQEAYEHIVSTLAEVNVIMGVRQVEQMMAAASELETEGENESGWRLQEDPSDDVEKSISGYFSPEMGNVVFASALDGWAFRLIDFARIFSEKQGISRRVLNKTLWGDYYLHAKSKRIVKRKVTDVRTKSKPMFVQCIMSNIHAVYDTLLKTQHDHELTVQKRKHFVSKLGVSVNARDINHRDASTALRAIMNSWLPASSCLLDTVVGKLPSVAEAQSLKNRVRALWGDVDDLCSSKSSSKKIKAEVIESFKRQQEAISQASTSKAEPFVAYVAKMIEKDRDAGGGTMNIRTPKTLEERRKINEQAALENTRNQDSPEASMIAFARILSGRLTIGDTVFVYSPKYRVSLDGRYGEESVMKTTVTELYLLMGRGMDPIHSASAGCVVGIGGLEECVLKTATLGSEPPGHCLPVGFNSSTMMRKDREALVRIAVEPHLLSDAGKLQNGLRRLNQADPAVDTFLTAKGEHIIAANGELHLERCLKDLRERFAKGVRIHVSKPIVPFRETVYGGFSPNVPLPESAKSKEQVPKRESETSIVESTDNNNAHEATSISVKSLPFSSSWRVSIEANGEPLSYIDSSVVNHGLFVTVSNESMSFRMTAAPLPAPLATVLDRAGNVFRTPELDGRDLDKAAASARQSIKEAIEDYAKESSSRKQSKASIVKFWNESIFPYVWCCGPNQCGSNLLVGPYPYSGKTEITEHIFGTSKTIEDRFRALVDIEKAIVTGFQLGTRAGPLCEEPLHGVVILLDSLKAEGILEAEDAKLGTGSATGAEAGNGEVDDEVNEISSMLGRSSLKSSPMSGVLIGCMRESVRTAVMHGNPRLMESILHVDISVPGSALGKTYTVLGQRRGRVLKEEMKEGVNVFGIEAYMPVQDSFGFADVLRKQTSGFAVPQMVFSHWEAVDLDPFWFPQTEEEVEDFGVSDSTAENNNIARKLVNGIRRRKGLKVEEKIVDDAEKQRTLSRKK